MIPSSDPKVISRAIELIIKVNPKTVLDVGCGFGKWGFLCREYLEVCRGRYLATEWKVRIDALEIYKDYITDIHKHLYNNAIIGDLREASEHVGSYDLVILGDVLEHLKNDEADKVLRLLLQRNKWVLITTPKGYLRQGIESSYVRKNPHEKHLCGFTVDYFNQFKIDTIAVYKNMILVLLKGGWG